MVGMDSNEGLADIRESMDVGKRLELIKLRRQSIQSSSSVSFTSERSEASTR